MGQPHGLSPDFLVGSTEADGDQREPCEDAKEVGGGAVTDAAQPIDRRVDALGSQGLKWGAHNRGWGEGGEQTEYPVIGSFVGAAESLTTPVELAGVDGAQQKHSPPAWDRW